MNNPATTALAAHIADAQAQGLEPNVLDRAKQHLLDSLIAILSGAALRPGLLAISYANSRGGMGESTVAGGPRTNSELAAFANAISAHADETDDVNALARIHPGSSIVPAAVAMAEAYDRSGAELLTAVSLGYDVACAMNIGAWKTFHSMQHSPRTSHGLGQTFGAAAAAASLAHLPMEQTRHVLSYAAQQVAGIATFYRDPDHIGKAFTTSAMQAHSGVRAVELVCSGFTAIDDVFDGKPNAFDALGQDGDVDRVLHDLKLNRHVTTTDIKQYSVGGPIQAPVEALTRIMATHGIGVSDVASIDVRLPPQGRYIVDNRDMPDICLQVRSQRAAARRPSHIRELS
jgi:2-methylcitrate dehydratase PrpD